jgi:MFS family permease
MDRYLRLLRRRDFALLWFGATISALGDGMSFVALVWLLLDRGGDAGGVGWLAAAYTGPVIVGGLVAGMLLDRYDRRRLLAVDNLVRGLAIASLPLAAALGVLTTAHLFAVAAIYGFLFMISLAGLPAMIPGLVDPEEFTTANAMESLAYGIAGLAGPAAAGLLIAAAGAPVVLVIDAATYGVYVLCLLAMRPMGTAAAADGDGDAGGDASNNAAQRRSLRSAVAFILGSRPILAITVLFVCFNIGEGMLIVLLPIYARDVLAEGAGAYGAMASALTAGLLAGSLSVGAVGWRWPLGRSIAVAQALAGIALLGLLGQPPLVFAMATLFASGLCASSLTAWAQTIRMRLIPAELRGRVFALLRSTMQAAPPIGAIAAGLVLGGSTTGVPVLVAAIVAVIALPGVVGWFVPALQPAAADAADAANPVESAAPDH